MPDATVAAADFNCTDTGVNLQRLVGQVNFLRLKRDFKVVAICKGFWSVIDGGKS